MAVVIGTNSGFVTTAPTTDPSGWQGYQSNTYQTCFSLATTSAITITEMGFHANHDVAEADFDIGIYSDDSGPDELIHISANNTKTTGAGWKKVTGLNFELNASTTYWLAIQLDGANFVGLDATDSATGHVVKQSYGSKSSLVDPWDSTASSGDDRALALYALYEAAATGTNTQINIGDTWKEISAAKINIGDTWKEVAGMQVNIGDAWKTVF